MLMPKEPNDTEPRSSKDYPKSSPKTKPGSPKPSLLLDTKKPDKLDDGEKPVDHKSQDSDTKQDELEPDTYYVASTADQSTVYKAAGRRP